jgi:hypothetical protein
MPRSSTIFTATVRLSPASKGSDTVPWKVLAAGLRPARRGCPSSASSSPRPCPPWGRTPGAGTGCARRSRCPAPHRNLALAARHQLALGGVEVVKAVHLHLPQAIGQLASAAHRAGPSARSSGCWCGLLQVFGQQVGVHLRLQRGDAFECVDVLGRLGVEGEGAEHDHLGRGNRSPPRPGRAPPGAAPARHARGQS